MKQDNILDYFPEDAIGFDKDDVIILAKIYEDNLEGQMAVSLLRSQKIPNYLIGDMENSTGDLRLYIKKKIWKK